MAVITRAGRYLICRRRPNDHFGGYWEFPGGKKEARESWEACLRRELREELGVVVRNLQPFGRIRHQYIDRLISFRVFRCRLARGQPRPLGTQAIRWVRAERLWRYRFPPADLALIARLSLGNNLGIPRRGIPSAGEGQGKSQLSRRRRRAII
ncbi:MAG: (deoxy)nucleoside triphosphate pyrophosphohydrolase [Candidatus Omnitrophica bacterium]|nr:(deoxy)nucleoside triphosphate pyrophosphohydrolase [Candidatus Omnitrophota bacterium]